MLKKIMPRLLMLLGGFVIGFTIHSWGKTNAFKNYSLPISTQQGAILLNNFVEGVGRPRNYVVESYLTSLQMMHVTTDVERSNLKARMYALKSQYDSHYMLWTKNQPIDGLKDSFLKNIHRSATEFYSTVFDEFFPALENEDPVAVTKATRRIDTAYKSYRQIAEQLPQYSGQYRANNDDRLINTIIGIVLMALIVSAITFVIFMRLTVSRQSEGHNYSEKIALDSDPSNTSDLPRVK